MIMQPLELTIPLQPDEAAPTYLSRLAARNGIACAKHFCADRELDYRRIVGGCSTEVDRLARLSGVSPRRLMSGCVRKEGKAYRIRGERLVARSLRRNGFNVCPECLKADVSGTDLKPHAAAYGRLSWQVRAVRTCVTHGIALVDLGTGAGATAHDFSAVVRPHLKRLDELIDTSHRRPASELERYVLRRLDGRACSAPFLDDLDLHVAIRLCEVIGALSVHGRGVPLQQVDEGELHLAGSVGIDIAGGGERALQEFLTTLRREYPYGRRVRAGPRPPFTEFRAWLNGHSRDEAYGPLNALLQRHLADPKPVDIVDKTSRFPGSLPEPACAFVKKGRPRILRHPLLRRIPGSLGMTSASTTSPAVPHVRTVQLTEAARLLGCDQPLLLASVGHGILHPVGNGLEPGWRHAIPNADLDGLLARIMAGTTEVRDPPDGVVGLAEGANRLPCAPVEILRLMLAGCLAWVGRRIGLHGVGSLLFRIDELRPQVEAQAIEGPTLAEAAAMLGGELDRVRTLIDLGAITMETGLYARTGVPIDIVHAASFDGFLANTIDFRRLLRRMGSKPRDAVAMLLSKGVRPSYADERRDIAYYDRAAIAEALPNLRLLRPILWTSRLMREPL